MRKVVINPDYAHLSDFIHSLPAQFETTGTTIYEGRNILKKYQVGNIRLVVKRFKKPHLINRFVYGRFRSSKAARSYKYALILREEWIRTPKPIAYIEDFRFGLNDSYYVSLYANKTREIRELCGKEIVTKEDYRIIDTIGWFAGDMHEQQIYHLDYSPGNLLYRIVDKEPVISIVDINRMKFGEVTEEMGYKSFRRLWLTDEAFEIVANQYANTRGYDKKKAVKRILYYKNKFMRGRK